MKPWRASPGPPACSSPGRPRGRVGFGCGVPRPRARPTSLPPPLARPGAGGRAARGGRWGPGRAVGARAVPASPRGGERWLRPAAAPAAPGPASSRRTGPRLPGGASFAAPAAATRPPRAPAAGRRDRAAGLAAGTRCEQRGASRARRPAGGGSAAAGPGFPSRPAGPRPQPRGSPEAPGAPERRRRVDLSADMTAPLELAGPLILCAGLLAAAKGKARRGLPGTGTPGRGVRGCGGAGRAPRGAEARAGAGARGGELGESARGSWRVPGPGRRASGASRRPGGRVLWGRGGAREVLRRLPRPAPRHGGLLRGSPCGAPPDFAPPRKLRPAGRGPWRLPGRPGWAGSGVEP